VEDCFRWVDLTLDVPLLLFLLLHRRDQVHLPYQVGSTHKKASKLSSHPSLPSKFKRQELIERGRENSYDAKSPESQSRRLADLLFVLRDYKLAFKVYEELVKDFKGQQGASKYWESALVRFLLLAFTLSLKTFEIDRERESHYSTENARIMFDPLSLDSI